MHTRITVAVAAVGASLALAGPALAAKTTKSTAKLYVNGTSGTDQNGSNTCRLSTNPCATINQAISIAPNTATIEVAGGNYPEQLTISGKNLTIDGAGAARTIIDPSSLKQTTNDPNHPGTEQNDIITFNGVTGGGLENLTVNGAGYEPDSCSENYVGVYLLDSSAKLSSTDVENIVHDSNSVSCQPGANGGVYVADDDATTGNTGAYAVTMTDLGITNYDKNGITCRDADVSCTITDSSIIGDGSTGANAQNGIELYDAGSVTASGNTVTANEYTQPQFDASDAAEEAATGIYVINDGTVTITKNHLSDNDENIEAVEDQNPDDYAAGPVEGDWTFTGNVASDATNTTGQGVLPGVGDGIDIYGATSPQNNYLTVSTNTISGGADDGIGLFGVSGATIGGAKAKANTISGNAANGIYVGEYTGSDDNLLTPIASNNNTVSFNVVKTSGNDGILADAPDMAGNQQDGGNQFTSNTLQTNTRYDAEDLSTGTSTAMTNNQWMTNTCKPAQDSAPLGLCAK